MMRLRPASLRGRVVVGVLVLLAVLLTALFVVVDVLLSARLRSDLRTRIEDRISLAEQLDGALSPQNLVDRLQGDGVSASLCTPSSGGRPVCVGPRVAPKPPGGPGRPPTGGPPADPPTATPQVQQDGSTLFARTTLPKSGEVLSLAVDTGQVTTTVGRLVVLEVAGGLLTLAVAALLLGRIVGLALRPLDRMTALARDIAGGERGRRLGTGRPDTELGRTALAFDAMLDELETALAAASAAQARLRSFLSDASHELRSPLTGLQATAEQLLRDEPSRAGREHAYLSMVRETRRAARLVDDLLTMTRLEGRAPLATERLDIVDIVRTEVDRCRLVAPELDVRLTGADHAPVDGDPIRLGQVLANLLDNARHATSGHGTIGIDVSRTADTWRLDVTDSGPGVPAADRERIFDRLTRLDASRTRHTGGFGLGLPIARGLARAHGGDLTCLPSESGAHFRVTLPAAGTASVAAPRQSSVAEPAVR